MKIAVIGSTGGTGREVLTQGLSRGHAITAFTRRPTALAEMRGLHAMVSGDGRDPTAVQRAVRGQDAVISIISPPGLGPTTVGVDVARTIIAAMREAGVRRLVCVSSHSLVATRLWLVVQLVRWVFRNPYADAAAMERVVAASGLDETIVRPTQLTNGPATGRVRRLRDGRDFDGGPYRISRADLAAVLLDVAEGREESGGAIEVSGARGR